MVLNSGAGRKGQREGLESRWGLTSTALRTALIFISMWRGWEQASAVTGSSSLWCEPGVYNSRLVFSSWYHGMITLFIYLFTYIYIYIQLFILFHLLKWKTEQKAHPSLKQVSVSRSPHTIWGCLFPPLPPFPDFPGGALCSVFSHWWGRLLYSGFVHAKWAKCCSVPHSIPESPAYRTWNPEPKAHMPRSDQKKRGVPCSDGAKCSSLWDQNVLIK